MPPSNYQPPTAGDQDSETKSQSAETNMSSRTSTVADLLEQKGDKTISVRPEHSIEDAIKVLAENKIGAVLVRQGSDEINDIIGILSERDIIRQMNKASERILSLKVQDLMTKNVVTCLPEDPLNSILEKMTEGRFRHVPVIDENNILKGIVTIGDVVHYRLHELEYEALRMKQMIVG